VNKITGSILEKHLHYDPETGIFVWVRAPAHNPKLKGQIAGTVRWDGYRTIRIRCRAYYASHLACLWMLGKWPDEEMDHIDRDPSNDRWENLREADSSLNKWNQERHLSNPNNPLFTQVT
jgi:hypothetical protein